MQVGDDGVRAGFAQLLYLGGKVRVLDVVDAGLAGLRVAALFQTVGVIRVAEHAQFDAAHLDDVRLQLLFFGAVDAAVGKARGLDVVHGEEHAVVKAVEDVVVGHGDEVHARLSQSREQLRRGVEHGKARIGLVAVQAHGGLQIGDGVVRRHQGGGDVRVLRGEIVALAGAGGGIQLRLVHHHIAHGADGDGAGRKGRGRRLGNGRIHSAHSGGDGGRRAGRGLRVLPRRAKEEEPAKQQHQRQKQHGDDRAKHDRRPPVLFLAMLARGSHVSPPSPPKGLLPPPRPLRGGARWSTPRGGRAPHRRVRACRTGRCRRCCRPQARWKAR